MEASGLTAARIGSRPSVGRLPLVRAQDRALRWGLTAVAVAILALIGFFFVRLLVEAWPAFSRFGAFGFTFTNDWDVSRNFYGALPLLVGTLVTSAIALCIGVPIAVATALFVSELCPRRLRGPLTVMVELLAAVPSVVYGLWGVFVLIPKLHGFEQFVSDKLGFLPFVGRAIGETIAVTLVIGNAPTIGKQLFDQGYTLAAVIANEFGEAANNPTHRAALIAAGLVLFVLTLAVNVLARAFVVRGERGQR